MKSIYYLLLLSALPAMAEENGAAFKLRAIPEIHDANVNSPFAAAIPLTSLAHDRARTELEMRSAWSGVNLVATALSSAQEGGKPDNELLVNELYYDTTLFGQRFSLGKKILSWDVGFGFRPLDVIQQENRRSIFPSTLEGVPYLAWEKFTADEAWMLLLANPGRGRTGIAKNDESLALKYFRHDGNTDAHALLRFSQRYRLEAGIAFSSVVADGLEWHGSLLQQTQYEKSANTLASRPGPPLSATDPYLTQTLRQGRKTLLGATWTGESGVSLLVESWYDRNAYSAAEWRAAASLAQRQAALLGNPHIPETAVLGSLAYGTRDFARPNLLKKNLLLRLSQRSESDSFEPAIDMLYTPEDGGRVVTASLGFDANNTRVDAGLRVYGGRAGSAYRLLPEKRVAYLALQVAF
ncbi:MAG: hypothetical protein HY066_11415 [Betaproteobacteria bacterium]|nr:hypothetical protein [Betaproteobacteria bacterium]